jgi:predicted RND superfamily exporter protein
MESKEGSIHATALAIPSILTSGGILICAGYLLKFTSSLTAISEMGELIGRGAFLSMLLVAFFLPHILKHFDKPVMKSIWKKKGAN